MTNSIEQWIVYAQSGLVPGQYLRAQFTYQERSDEPTLDKDKREG